MSNDIVGAIAGLWRFPAKSMRGEQLAEAELTATGLVGDRAYALIETDTGKVVSAKNARVYPRLLDCKAAFVTPPQTGSELPAVRITLPDGTTIAIWCCPRTFIAS